MAKREVLGVMDCPECGRSGAEIKAQKTGLLYRWCGAGCNAQFFARNGEQETAMRRHVSSVPVTDTATGTLSGIEPPAVAAPPVPVAAPEPKQKPKGTGNALLDLINGA